MKSNAESAVHEIREFTALWQAEGEKLTKSIESAMDNVSRNLPIDLLKLKREIFNTKEALFLATKGFKFKRRTNTVNDIDTEMMLLLKGKVVFPESPGLGPFEEVITLRYYPAMSTRIVSNDQDPMLHYYYHHFLISNSNGNVVLLGQDGKVLKGNISYSRAVNCWELISNELLQEAEEKSLKPGEFIERKMYLVSSHE